MKLVARPRATTTCAKRSSRLHGRERSLSRARVPTIFVSQAGERIGHERRHGRVAIGREALHSLQKLPGEAQRNVLVLGHGKQRTRQDARVPYSARSASIGASGPAPCCAAPFYEAFR